MKLVDKLFNKYIVTEERFEYMKPIYSSIIKFLVFIMNITLFLVGLVLCGAVIDSLLGLSMIAWDGFFKHTGFSEVIEELISFFLYFEFLALIVKYFKNNYHFPLDYFLYIGITAIVRLLIVSHETAVDTLIWAISIFVLVVSLVLVEKYVRNE